MQCVQQQGRVCREGDFARSQHSLVILRAQGMISPSFENAECYAPVLLPKCHQQREPQEYSLWTFAAKKLRAKVNFDATSDIRWVAKSHMVNCAIKLVKKQTS